MSRLSRKLGGTTLLILLLFAAGCQNPLSQIPQLSAEEWLEQAVVFVNKNAEMSYAANRQVFVSDVQMAVQPEAQNGDRRYRELRAAAPAESRTGGGEIDPVKWLNEIVRVKSGVSIRQAVNGLILEVELAPEQWTKLLKKDWQESWQSLSAEHEKRKQNYLPVLSQDEASKLEAEIQGDLEEARQYLLRIGQTLSADGSCELLIDPKQQMVKQLNLELMLHYGEEENAKDEKWLAEYNFSA